MVDHRTGRACVGGCVALAAALGAGLAGCSRGGLASELAVQPQPQIVRATESTTLDIPKDQPFAIALAPSQESPGLEGTADADAHATKDGSADARAEVKNGGKATAAFQLGHAIKNDTDRQVDLDLKVRCRCEYQAKAEPVSGLPDATVGLMLYARTAQNRPLIELSLVGHSTEKGAVSETGDKELSFTVTLGPGETANIYLGGEAKVETEPGRSASGALAVRNLQMQIVTRPAPPVAKASDAQK